MRIPALRHYVGPVALAALATLALAGAGTAALQTVGPVQAGPAQAAPALAAPVLAAPVLEAPAPAAPAPDGRASARQAVNTGKSPSYDRSSCSGAVVRPVDSSTIGRTTTRLCIAVGGVVRVQHLGPGGLAVQPRSRAECNYEAGVHECRLIRTGTVTLSIRGERARALTVTVAKASIPPKPSPACLPATTVFRVDAAEGGPPWWALCMKVGAVLRVENLGPAGLAVTPRSAVSCNYAAGVHECRMRRAATVSFRVTHDQETRPLTVVAIR